MNLNYGKTNYKFQIHCDPQLASNTISQWLKENNFVYTNQYGEGLYACKDPWTGNRGFQCTLINQELNIYAWTIGLGDKFVMLDSGAVNNSAGNYYKRILSELFSRLEALHQGNANTIPRYTSNPQSAPPLSQVADDLKKETSKTSESLCTLGFWLSIVGILLLFCGITYGGLLYAFVMYWSIQGLKTKKKKLAIATIVITGVSFLVLILSMLFS